MREASLEKSGGAFLRLKEVFMAFIGIVGARKFKDRKAVEDLVVSLPKDSIIVTSGCDGVCQTDRLRTPKTWNNTIKIFGSMILIIAWLTSI